MTTTVKPRKSSWWQKAEESAIELPEILEFAEESERPKGALARIRGRVAKTNIVNGNNRYYSKAIWEGAINEANDRIRRGRMLGEIVHPRIAPEDHDPLEKAAIKFERLFFEDDANDPERPFVAYEGLLIDNEFGRHLKSLMDVGVDVGISSRGRVKMRTGSVESRSDVNIVERFILKGIDSTGIPSNEFGQNLTCESEEDEMDDDLTVEKLEKDHADVAEAVAKAYVSKYSLVTPEQMEKMVQRMRDSYAEVTVDDKFLTESLELPLAMKPVVESFVTLLRDEVKSTAEKATTKHAEEMQAAVEKAQADAKAAQEKAIADALKPVNEKLEASEKALAEANDKLAAESRKASRADKIKTVCESAEHAAYATILRTQLEAVKESVEFDDAFVAEKVDEAQRIWKALGSPKGKGVVKPSGAGQKDTKEGDEATESKVESRHAQLAGFD